MHPRVVEAMPLGFFECFNRLLSRISTGQVKNKVCIGTRSIRINFQCVIELCDGAIGLPSGVVQSIRELKMRIRVVGIQTDQRAESPRRFVRLPLLPVGEDFLCVGHLLVGEHMRMSRHHLGGGRF